MPRCYQSSLSQPTTALVLPSHPELSIRHVMAPMVAASDYPFRCLLQQNGVDLMYTQMFHAQNFVSDAKFRKSHLDLWETGVRYDDLLPTQLDCLGTESLPSIPPQLSTPLMVQLAGNEVDKVVQAAMMLLDHTDGRISGIDLNCGCPQGIAKKGRYGAFLMEQDSDRVNDILRALRQHLPDTIAVSAKIRLPLDDTLLQGRIQRLLDTGIQFLTIHGRTLHENKTKVGEVHKDRMKMAIETAHAINPNFPVIANGGMEDYNDVQDMLEYTGAVAAMSSEGLLETPNLFQKSSLNLSPHDRLHQQVGFARTYLNLCTTVGPPLPGVQGTAHNSGGSFGIVRGHLFKFLYRYLSEHVDLRNALADNRKVKNIPHALAVIDELEGRYLTLSTSDWMECQSASKESSWYRRHRKSNRIMPSAMEVSLSDRKQQIKERVQRLRELKRERQAAGTKRYIS